MSPPFLVTAGPTLGLAGVVPAFALGAAASATFTAFGVVGAARITVAAETLPAEWAFVDNGDGTGTLSTGSTLVAGEFSLTLRVVDANRQPVVRTFAVRVIALPVSVSGTLDPFVVTVAVSDVLTISGGTGTYASVTTQSGALPAGVSVALVGDELQFSGSPTATGAWSVVLRVTDSAGAFADVALSGTITALALTISGGPLLDATEGEAYSDTLTISGGVPPYTLDTVTGMPSGLSASITGSTLTVSGTPDAGESDDSPFSLSIEVEDTEAETEVYTQSFVVDGAVSYSALFTSNSALLFTGMQAEVWPPELSGYRRAELLGVQTAGKRAFEVEILEASTSPFVLVGIWLADDPYAFVTGAAASNFHGHTTYSWGYYQETGAIYNNNSAITSGLATYTNGDVVRVEVDVDGGTVAFYKNGTLQTTESLPTGYSWGGGCSLWRREPGAHSVLFRTDPATFTSGLSTGFDGWRA